MSALSILKSSAELIVSVGAGAVVGNAIKASIPRNANKLNKITIGIGGFVISGMVGEMASKYVTDNIDQAAETARKLKDAVNVSKTNDGFKVEVEDVEQVAETFRKDRDENS